MAKFCVRIASATKGLKNVCIMAKHCGRSVVNPCVNAQNPAILRHRNLAGF